MKASHIFGAAIDWDETTADPLVELAAGAVNLRSGVLRVLGKGSKERLLPIGEEAQHWLQRYLDAARPGLARGRQPQALFLSRLGEGMSRQMFWHSVKQLALRAGIPGEIGFERCRVRRVVEPVEVARTFGSTLREVAVVVRDPAFAILLVALPRPGGHGGLAQHVVMRADDDGVSIRFHLLLPPFEGVACYRARRTTTTFRTTPRRAATTTPRASTRNSRVRSASPPNMSRR